MRVSEWLVNNTDSHGIYSAVDLQRSYAKDTGMTDMLPTHTIRETRQRISADPRGGEIVETDDATLCCYGYELARFLADRYGKDREYRNKTGRGFLYRAAVESMRANGN